MAKGSYNGGSTIIRTGNANILDKPQAKKQIRKPHQKIKGYVLHKRNGEQVLSAAHGLALLENGTCREIGSWEGYVSLEYVRPK